MMLSGVAADWRANSFAYVLILPAALLVLSVVVYPVYFAAEFSFYNSVIFSKGDFVGLDNYAGLFSASIFRNAVASLIFVGGSIVLAVGAGLGLALLLNGKVMLRTTFRTVIFIPWVTSQIASGLVWRWLANPDYGPIVYALQEIGGPRIDLLGDRNLAMAVLIFTNAWRSVAFSMIVILSGLQTIPESVIRSALIDGASAWRTFRSITFPLLLPSIFVCVITSTFSYFNIITIPLILTGGGPQDATELITLRMYREAFSYFNVGFASAVTMLILALNIGLTFLYLKLPGRKGVLQ